MSTLLQLHLPELIDLALASPKIGQAMNLQILHTVLHIIVKRASLDGVPVEIDGPMSNVLETILAKNQQRASLTLKEFDRHGNEVGKRVAPKCSTMFRIESGMVDTLPATDDDELLINDIMLGDDDDIGELSKRSNSRRSSNRSIRSSKSKTPTKTKSSDAIKSPSRQSRMSVSFGASGTAAGGKKSSLMDMDKDKSKAKMKRTASATMVDSRPSLERAQNVLNFPGKVASAGSISRESRPDRKASSASISSSRERRPSKSDSQTSLKRRRSASRDSQSSAAANVSSKQAASRRASSVNTTTSSRRSSTDRGDRGKKQIVSRKSSSESRIGRKMSQVSLNRAKPSSSTHSMKAKEERKSVTSYSRRPSATSISSTRQQTHHVKAEPLQRTLSSMQLQMDDTKSHSNEQSNYRLIETRLNKLEQALAHLRNDQKGAHLTAGSTQMLLENVNCISCGQFARNQNIIENDWMPKRGFQPSLHINSAQR